MNSIRITSYDVITSDAYYMLKGALFAFQWAYDKGMDRVPWMLFPFRPVPTKWMNHWRDTDGTHCFEWE